MRHSKKHLFVVCTQHPLYQDLLEKGEISQLTFFKILPQLTLNHSGGLMCLARISPHRKPADAKLLQFNLLQSVN